MERERLREGKSGETGESINEEATR